MKTIFSLFVLLAAMPVFAQKKITLTVNENSVPCRRMMEQTCLQVMREGSTEWELFYDRIKGFEFEPGYRYVIVITETPRPEPVPQDLSKNTYSLDKIISKTVANDGGAVPTPDPTLTYLVVRELNGLRLNSDKLYFQLRVNRLEGRTPCNGLLLPVEWNSKKTKIKVGTGMHTMIACEDQNLQQIENDFYKAVSNKKFRIKHRDGKIIWKKGFRQVLVLDTMRGEVAMPIAGKPMRTGWDYFQNKELRIIQLNGTSYDVTGKLTFSGRTFSGNSGCNSISGALKSDGTNIAFSNVVSTKMMCADPQNDFERQVLQILNSSGLHMDFAEKVLNIYDAKGNLVMMLAA